MLTTKGLLLAAAVVASVPAIAQSLPASPNAAGVSAVPVVAQPEVIVEGATPGLVAQIERCSGHKFESLVEVDPVKKRSTRVKLCANPGSSDADWVKTLEAAIVQIEQRDMPPAAKSKLLGELRSEAAKFAVVSKPAAIVPMVPLMIGGEAGRSGRLIAPSERYETSVLPPLTPRKAVTTATAAIKSQPKRQLSIRLKCLARGQSGSGGTCDFFDRDTVLAISAVEGLENGGMLRFRRRGEARGEVTLAPMRAGQSVRVRLPADLCRGVAYSKVEIELLDSESAGAVAARLGSYGLRC